MIPYTFGVQRNQELIKFLQNDGFLFVKEVPSHGLCGIRRMLFTVGIFYGLDGWGYKGRYCYRSKYDALCNFYLWNGNGDPPGPWIKHFGG